MKAQYLYALLAAIAFLTAQSFAFTVSPRRLAMGEIALHGTLNTVCLPTRGGTAYLQIDIQIEGFPVADRAYRTKNIAVVLDRSGSMAEEQKLDYAKQAIASLVDQLGSADYLSVVLYDNEATVLIPRERVRDKNRIKELLRRLKPGGGTNLGAGMIEGFRQIEDAPGGTAVNRVILLSDGLANRGVTSARELMRIAQSYRSRSISLTAMGVGLDYNEDLMMSLAEAGGGNYYFIERPRQTAGFFERELGGIASVIAQNATIDLTPGPGVVVRDVIGYEWSDNDGRVTIQVGDLLSDDRREITVELGIPAGTGSRRVASGRLRYPKADDRNPATFSVDVRHSDDFSEIERGTNWEIQAKAEIALSTRSVERAMKEYDAGRPEEAARAIDAARRSLLSSPAHANAPSAAPRIDEQAEGLRSFSRIVGDSTLDRKQVKKSVQFKNYETQKRKP